MPMNNVNKPTPTPSTTAGGVSKTPSNMNAIRSAIQSTFDTAKTNVASTGVATQPSAGATSSLAQATQNITAPKAVGEGDVSSIKVPTREDVENAIKQSKDVSTALEAVGAMFGIPSTSFLQDCDTKCIKVVDDTIVSPCNKNTMGNTSSIVCAIGSVLDFISQRIDDKLNNYQSNVPVDACHHHDHHCHDTKIHADANPAKGKVIERVCDSEGNEIIIYDSGLCDIPHSDAGRAKYKELLNMGKIPEYNPDLLPCNQPVSYFTDEDIITNGIEDIELDEAEPDYDAEVSNEIKNTDTDTDSTTTESYTNIANEINESETILHLIEEFEHTTHLGYEIFTSIGFDCVKPMDSYIEESAKDQSPRQ